MGTLSLSGGTVVTSDARGTILPRGTIVIRDGVVEAVLESAARADRTIDCRGRLILPGLVNLHAHAGESLFRGAGGDLGLVDWVERVSHPLAGALDAAGSRAAARLTALEMLRSGTTAFLDPEVRPDHVDAVAGALGPTGIRAALAIGMADGAGYGVHAHEHGRPVSADGQARHEHEGHDHEDGSIEAILRRLPPGGRVTAWLGPRVLSAVSPELGARIASLASEHGTGITFHCAEIPQDGEAVRARSGQGPGAYAGSIGLLGERSVLTHGVHLDDDDLAVLAETGTHVAHCPTSNAKIGGGVARVTEMRARGIEVGLGTDGGNSNDTYDIVAEMRMAALLQRASRQDAGAMSAATVLEMATRTGADALGLAAGRLEPGALGDCVVIQPRREGAWPTVDPVHSLVFGAGGAVESVVIDGEVVVERGQVTTMDAATVLADAEEAAAAALARSGVRERLVPGWWADVQDLGR
jgi:cytosine/adenosine deaminase-related metal-dependent hydrolase